MGQKTPLHAVVLFATLKPLSQPSNVGGLTEQVCGYLTEHQVTCEVVSLFEKNIPPGVKSIEGGHDDWPEIEQKIRTCDILIFATPIWWTGHSSLMQRALERMDALDEEYRNTGVSPLYNKVAGIITTGSEDGALRVIDALCGFSLWLGLTVPPEGAAYWVGEVGGDPKTEHQRREANKATDRMAQRMAQNLANFARLLKEHPLQSIYRMKSGYD